MATIKDVIPTGSNSGAMVVSECLAVAIEAAKHFGVSKLANDKDKLGIRAAYFVVYQEDEYKRAQVNHYLTSQTKIGTKADKERAKKWLHSEFELVQPKKGAMGDHVTKYNNTIAGLKRALSDIRSVYERGIRVVVVGKDVRVTAATYSKVMEAETKEDVPITMMNSKNSVTFNGLVVRKPKVPIADGTKGKQLAATAANVSPLCEAARVAIEQCTPDKLTGKERLSLLNVFFAVHLALDPSSKPDKHMTKMYEEVTAANVPKIA